MAEKFSVDGDLVRGLAKLLEETGLTEVEYKVGTHQIPISIEEGKETHFTLEVKHA